MDKAMKFLLEQERERLQTAKIHNTYEECMKLDKKIEVVDSLLKVKKATKE